MDLKKPALKFHAKHKGKIFTKVMPVINSRKTLSLAYTPGVGEVSRVIASDKEELYKYTIKSHTVGVVSDGSAVLGLGNIGPEAALPVMEGKAALFKTFAGLDAFPICLNTQDPDMIVATVKAIAPVFGGINLEDISAPRCFKIEESLQDLGIPVMHDDQHGTAVVVLAGVLNAAKLAGKKLSELTVVISGAGAAGQAVTRLICPKVKEVRVLDSKGLIYSGRGGLDEYKKQIAKVTNRIRMRGGLKEALRDGDVFIGVSKANLLTAKDLEVMAPKPIVFAMANPIPEIMPDEAKKGGAFIVGTGRSDFPNQINNSLAFPGIFKGALESRVPRITEEMKLKAAQALANLVSDPTPEKIIPGPFDPEVAESVAQAVSS